MSNIIPFEGAKVPAYLKQAEAAPANELMANVGGGGFPVMSIKGKSFTIVKGGERTTLMNPNDEDEVATSITAVILKANASLSKIWYAKAYAEGSDAKPDCFSNDGIAPDPSVESPQAKKCSICPKNEWGSRIGDDGRKGKACSDSRRLAIAPPDDLENPMLLRAPPATLKPLAEYGAELAKRGVPYNAVITKIGFDREAASPKLTFKPVGFLSEEQYTKVQEVVGEDVVASILGKIGETPVPEAGDAPTVAEAPAEKVEKPAPKAEKPAKAAKAKPKVEVEDEDEETPPPPQKAEKPAKAAKAAVVYAEDDLESELETMLNEVDD